MVETEQGTARHALEPSGTTYVRRLWRTRCEDAMVRSALAISYSDSWQVVGSGDDAARIPLEITPGNRCDEHARGQATAPFDFLMRLRIGHHGPATHAIQLPLPAMEAATEALDLACAREKLPG